MVEKNVSVHLSKAMQCTVPKVNPDVNDSLWVIMMCQHRFIDCTTLLGDVGSGRGCVHVGVGGIWEFSALCCFAVNLKLF